MMNYAKIAFSETIQKLQEKSGSRANYARMEKMSDRSGLDYNEIQFIGERESFYMASIGENGFPYIQFRGGPKGFLKVIDQETLAFLDFRGNMQFISVGNMTKNNRVALILLDYPSKTRLKIYAEAQVMDLAENAELAEKLKLSDYKAKPERIILLKIKAFDWNCQQHITPRYTLEEIQEVFEAQQAYIRELEEKIKATKFD
jgi:predicted pyridoxine 5'-phosphate oxidase superfamily flavin-nucleotide-binding protein